MYSEGALLPTSLLREIYPQVAAVYAPHSDQLPFHGWSHIDFVYRNALRSAAQLGADLELVGLAALTHDVNYLVADSLDAADGLDFADELLRRANVPNDRIRRVLRIILEAQTSRRGPDISAEAMALSDGDSLYKCLPVTPVSLAPRFLQENSMDLRSLARKIVGEQKPLLEQGIYFYSPAFKARYEEWARLNLELWEAVELALADDEIAALVEGG